MLGIFPSASRQPRNLSLPRSRPRSDPVPTDCLWWREEHIGHFALNIFLHFPRDIISRSILALLRGSFSRNASLSCNEAGPWKRNGCTSLPRRHRVKKHPHYSPWTMAASYKWRPYVRTMTRRFPRRSSDGPADEWHFLVADIQDRQSTRLPTRSPVSIREWIFLSGALFYFYSRLKFWGTGLKVRRVESLMYPRSLSAGNESISKRAENICILIIDNCEVSEL